MSRLRLVHPLVWVLGALAGVLLFFCDKALHIDDPLFAWTAERMQTNPRDFYGFRVNWNGTTVPMPRAQQNPPSIAYYMALIAHFFGWREVVLHLAFLLPTLGAAAGIYYLAKAWCKQPALAVVIAIATPVFLVSATTLMCDVPMLMFWVWAIVLWEKGLEGKGWLLLVAGWLAGLAVLTKYNGILLLPLLAFATVLRRRSWSWSAAGLLIPILMLLVYEHATARLYGQGHFAMSRNITVATRASLAQRDEFHYESQAVSCLAFLGGGFAAAVFCSIRLWSGRVLLVGGGAAFLATLGFCSSRATLGATPVVVSGRLQWPLLLQVALWTAGGLSLLALAAVAWWRQRDRTNSLLAVWIAGGIGYCIFVNWMVSGRSLLWIIPPVAIVVARQLERSNLVSVAGWKLWIPLAGAALLAVSVASADYRLANSARQAAGEITAKYRPSDNRPLWFEGHWGFQYYMQALGGRAVDLVHPEVKAGDWIIMPYNMVNVVPPPPDSVNATEMVQLRPCSWLATMNGEVGAAFYASQIGPLPFFFGPIPPEVYYVQRMARPLPQMAR
jgi:4-amino-4-deoxy-L-arabinose transferase-like glycosyltransferase